MPNARQILLSLSEFPLRAMARVEEALGHFANDFSSLPPEESDRLLSFLKTVSSLAILRFVTALKDLFTARLPESPERAEAIRLCLERAWKHLEGGVNPEVQEYGRMAVKAAPVIEQIIAFLVEQARQEAETIYDQLLENQKTIPFQDFIREQPEPPDLPQIL